MACIPGPGLRAEPIHGASELAALLIGRSALPVRRRTSVDNQACSGPSRGDPFVSLELWPVRMVGFELREDEAPGQRWLFSIGI